MCEMLAISSPDPIHIDQVLDWAYLLDEFGIAGFGWGMAWSDGETLHRYRSALGIRQDSEASRALRHITIQRGFVHLRRPSLMSSAGHLNAQPYVSPDGEWSFAHNGYLRRHQEYRERFKEKLQGTSDSEVGFWYWLDIQATSRSLPASLIDTHQTFEGKANLIALHRRGDLAVYAGNEDNAVYTFNVGPVHCAATSLHSRDRFLFDAVFPAASRIEHLPPGTAMLL